MFASHHHEQALAWALADFAAPHLPSALNIELFAMIGAGDVRGALQRLLECCRYGEVDLPLELATRIRTWADGYAGTETELILRPYVHAMQCTDYDSGANRTEECVTPLREPSP